MTPLAFANAVDLGGGRGRAAPLAAASIFRIDAKLGRLADINEAWRSPEQANKNKAAWEAYQNGTGPVAPFALGADASVHCAGEAADSDDWYRAEAAAIWYAAGWRQTARYPNNPKKDEPWHGEYFKALDQFFGQMAGGNAVPFNPTKDGNKVTVYARDGKDGAIFAIPEGGPSYAYPSLTEYNAARGLAIFMNERLAKLGKPVITVPPTPQELIDNFSMDRAQIHRLMQMQGSN